MSKRKPSPKHKQLSLSDTRLKLLEEAVLIDAEDAKEADAIGFMAKILVQTTMPHRKLMEGKEELKHFERSSGHFHLGIYSPYALPYGSIPRLLLAWITTEAVRTKESVLILGDSLSQFMGELDIVPTGGRWGSITRLKEQCNRLFSSSISCYYDSKERFLSKTGLAVVEEAELWWSPKRPSQVSLWQSKIKLGQEFYKEIIKRPVPVDMRALKALKKSPMALDIYCWLTWRVSHLQKSNVIPWEALKLQFGAEYKHLFHFKSAFLRQLKKVLIVYPQASIEDAKGGLLIEPSPTHISKKS